MKTPTLRSIHGKVEQLAGALEIQVGRAIGSAWMEQSGRSRQLVGDARQELAARSVFPVEVAAPVLEEPAPRPNRAHRRHHLR